jgi:FkbM family methyltransferase
MKSQILYIFFKFIPKRLWKILGESSMLRVLRNALIRDQNGFSIVMKKKIRYAVSRFKNIEFIFIAPPKVITKAEKFGIENNITRTVYSHCESMKSGIIVDVGSNYGFLSLVWAASLPELSIHSYEIHPSIFQTLTTAAEENGFSNLNVFQQAVSDKRQTLFFNLKGSTASIENNIQLVANQYNVESVTLDYNYLAKELPPIVAIKIGTDGSDYNVLVGAENLIKTFKPLVIIETNNDSRIINFLFDVGYTVKDMAGNVITDINLVDWTSPAMGNIIALHNN